MKIILKMAIPITYLLMVTKRWSLDNKYIIYIMIFYLGWTIIQALTYKHIKYNNNKRSFQCIDQLTIETVHEIIERKKFITYFSSLIFVLLLKILYRWFYYINRYNGSSIIQWLFKNLKFVWQRLNILSIVKVDILLVTWKTMDKMLLSM